MNVEKIAAFVCIGLLISFLSCKNNSVDPSNVASNKADSTIQAYIKAQGLTAKLASSGAYYAITTANPAGKSPVDGEEIAYKFVGRTLAGKLIDTTLKDTTYYVALGSAGIVTGLQEIFRTMRVGETASIFLYNSTPIVDASRTVLLPAYTPYTGSLTMLASRTEDQQIDQYVADNKLTVTEKTSSGLRFIKTLSNPTSATVTAGQTVTVKYSGITIRASQPFDPGTNPLTFTLGKSQVVPGFEEGVSKLKVGEKATVIFPSVLGYGSGGRQTQLADGSVVYAIKPYSPLIFTLEIVSAQ